MVTDGQWNSLSSQTISRLIYNVMRWKKDIRNAIINTSTTYWCTLKLVSNECLYQNLLNNKLWHLTFVLTYFPQIKYWGLKSGSGGVSKGDHLPPVLKYDDNQQTHINSLASIVKPEANIHCLTVSGTTHKQANTIEFIWYIGETLMTHFPLFPYHIETNSRFRHHI